MSVAFVIFGLHLFPFREGEAQAYEWWLQRRIFIHDNIYFITHTEKGVSTEEYRDPGLW